MKIVTLVDANGKALSEVERIRRLRAHLIEAHFMIKLGQHPNLVSIRAAYQTTSDFHFFLDLVPGGLTLSEVMKDTLLMPAQMLIVAFGMAKGLAYMHDTCGLRHFDLKPKNVLVELINPAVDDSIRTVGVVKLTDFGCSAKGCTWAYASPQTRAVIVPPGVDDDPNQPCPFAEMFSSKSNITAIAPLSTNLDPLHPPQGTLEGNDMPNDKFEPSSIVCLKECVESKVDVLPRPVQLAVESQDQWSCAREVPCGMHEKENSSYNLCLSLALHCLNDDPKTRPAMRNVVEDLGASLTAQLVELDAKVEGALSPMELLNLHETIGNTFYLQISPSERDYQLAHYHFSAARFIAEQSGGRNSAIFATSLNNLALLLDAQGKYDEARPLYECSLMIREQIHGPNHPDVSLSLRKLAMLYEDQGNYSDAEALYERALNSDEQVYGSNHPDVATSLYNVAMVLNAQGKYEQAKPIYERSLEIDERVHGPNHPDTATSLNNLAQILTVQGEYNDARPYIERALKIDEHVHGPKHSYVATSLNNLAELLKAQGKFAEAKALYERALKIREKELDPTHPSVAVSLNNLALLLSAQGNYSEALEHCSRALNIAVEKLGPNHPHTKNIDDVYADIRSKL